MESGGSAGGHTRLTGDELLGKHNKTDMLFGRLPLDRAAVAVDTAVRVPDVIAHLGCLCDLEVPRSLYLLFYAG